MATLTQEQINTLKDRGLTDQKIQEIAQSRGLSMPGVGGIGGIALGAGKQALGIATGVSRGLQGFGQRVLAGIDPTKTLEDIRAETGFKSLDVAKPEGQAVQEALETRGVAEKTGARITDVATFFVPGAKAAQVAGRATQAIGRGTAARGVGLSQFTAPLVQSYRAQHTVPQRIAAALQGKTLSGRPLTEAETALRKNLFGTESMIGIQAKRASGNLWKQVVQPSLKSVKEQVNFPSFVNELREQVRLIPDPSRRRELEKALNVFAKDHSGLKNVPYTKLQTLKEGWAKFLPTKAFKGQDISGSFREVQNMASQLGRNKIYEKLGPEIRAAYLDYGNLKNLEALGESALRNTKFKGGAGTLVSGLYDTAVTPLASSAGLTLYKAGRGLEFVGNKGISTVRGIFGI